MARERPAGTTTALHEPMQERATEEPAPNLGDVLEKTLHHAKNLLQAELSLARTEMTREISSAFGSVALLVVGAMFLQAALTALTVFLIIAFGAGILAIVVIALVAGTGAACCLVGKRALQRRGLPRTSARLALDAQQLMETVK